MGLPENSPLRGKGSLRRLIRNSRKDAEERALMDAVIEAARAHRDFARGQIDLTPTKMKEAIRLFDSLGHAIQALDNYRNTSKGETEL